MPETYKNIADYPWQLDGFDARMECTGWPTWRENWRDYQLGRCPPDKYDPYEWGRQYKDKQTGVWAFDAYLTDHEAACLIREWWREWLESQGLSVLRFGRGHCVWSDKTHSRLTEDGFVNYAKECLGFDTYDAAQAAAIDAVKKEER